MFSTWRTGTNTGGSPRRFGYKRQDRIQKGVRVADSQTSSMQVSFVKKKIKTEEKGQGERLVSRLLSPRASIKQLLVFSVFVIVIIIVFIIVIAIVVVLFLLFVFDRDT